MCLHDYVCDNIKVGPGRLVGLATVSDMHPFTLGLHVQCRLARAKSHFATVKNRHIHRGVRKTVGVHSAMNFTDEVSERFSGFWPQ